MSDEEQEHIAQEQENEDAQADQSISRPAIGGGRALRQIDARELKAQGHTEFEGENDVVTLNNLANRIGVGRHELCVPGGPMETVRISAPTTPKRNTKMGER